MKLSLVLHPLLATSILALCSGCKSSGSGPLKYETARVSRGHIVEHVTASGSLSAVLLGSVAGISLLVGGIGIMNIMLVSVSERTREIGIRVAVGAQPGDIQLQFLIEAMILSLTGGAFGVVLGVGASTLIGVFAHFKAIVSVESIVLAFGVSFVIGVFFGFYPARKAAALNPIDALRYE